MARKAAAPVVDTKSDLVERLGEFSHFKNVDRATLMSVLEDVFRSMIFQLPPTSALPTPGTGVHTTVPFLRSATYWLA